MLRISFAVLLVFCGFVQTSFGGFVINLNFTGQVFELTDAQKLVVQNAAFFWEQKLDYKAETHPAQLTIDVGNRPIDGPGTLVFNQLAEGGPLEKELHGGYTYARRAFVNFDISDLLALTIDNKLLDVAKHEIAHAIGFGTLWTDNGIYVNGTGQYTGAAALAAYRNEFDANATFVPVELKGGPETIDGHWSKEVFDNELMTGILGPAPFISFTTHCSFCDIGYLSAECIECVPEPSTIVLAVLALPGVAALRRIRKEKRMLPT